MASHVNLDKVDLSKFSPRAIRCLKEWLVRGFYRRECPFDLDSYSDDSAFDNYKCRNFCFKVFPFKVINNDYRNCPCNRYSEKYVLSTVKAIIKVKE